LERATSTTLRIKVAKANNAARIRHKSASDICVLHNGGGIATARETTPTFMTCPETGPKWMSLVIAKDREEHAVTPDVTKPLALPIIFAHLP